MKKKVLALSEADRAALAEIVKKGQDWRMRHRAQTLLYFSEGCSAKDIATRQDSNSHFDFLNRSQSRSSASKAPDMG